MTTTNNHVTTRRFARWIDYGAFRFSFTMWTWDTERNELSPLFRISDRKGKASLYRETDGGWILSGFTSCEPLQAGFVSMSEYDRLTLWNELVEE